MRLPLNMHYPRRDNNQHNMITGYGSSMTTEAFDNMPWSYWKERQDNSMCGRMICESCLTATPH